jgi:hypothetical protein
MRDSANIYLYLRIDFCPQKVPTKEMAVDLSYGFQFGAFIAEPLKGCVIGNDQRLRHLPPKAMAVLDPSALVRFAFIGCEPKLVHDTTF